MGYKIKELRLARGFTQTALARKSGISRGTISALESGSSKITSTKTLLKIASALETTVDQIFFEDCV